jgi:zinc protease
VIVALTALMGPASAADAVPDGAPESDPLADPLADTVELVPDGPDRSGPPQVAPPVLLALPEPEVHPLAPGVEAMLVRAPGARKVAVQVVFRQGQIELDGGVDQAGRAAGWLADAAAGGLSGAELSELADLHEVSLYSGIDLHEGGVELEVPLEDLATGLDLQAMVLREPSFPRRELKRYVTDQRLFYQVSGPTSQAALASAALAYGWFPADHPYGTRPDLAELGRLRPRALRERWQGWVHQAPVTVLVVGDVGWDQVAPAVTAMVDGLGREGPPGAGLALEPPAATRVIGVHLPGQAQVALRMRAAAPSRGAPEAPAAIALDDILGGQFLSRLNRNLREEKGFTYGARSRYQRGEQWGAITVSVDVDVENVGATITEIERELQRLVDEPVTAEELDGTRRLLAADWNRTFETASDAMGRYAAALRQGWTIEGDRARHQAVMDATADDLQAVARTWLAPDRARLWVVVADRDVVGPALEERGWDVAWVDPADAILGKF